MSQSCPACRADNPPGARFCNQCGQKLDAPASKSEARAEKASAYTPKHLAEKIFKTRAALEGERKRVTVLFCDIKGSTRLAQQAGAEQWHLILDRFFTILAGAVHSYEGTVNQYTGDGIMALFGAPIAHEDHAQRACFTALEIQREVRRFADELRLSRSLNLSIRVGLNTGEVIVGRIGDDLRMDYTAQGPTVNLAARMEHICEPGRIYLTRNTARLVEGYFRLRDLGRMNVDGLDEAVEVYDLEGEGSLKTRLDRSLARGASLFVGRERELGLLTEALERVRNGEGQIIAVVGNAGIGKSRLCHEFSRACEDSNIVVHRATGVPYAGAAPMLPVQTLAKSRLGLPENASAQDIRKFVAGELLLRDPQLASILPVVFDFLGAGDGIQLAPDQAAAARKKMLDLLAHYLPCPEYPQIILVEDLHFLDPGSEEFFAHLCAHIHATKTLLLLNYRPDYVNEWLIPYLDEQIAVSALTPAQLENLAADWLGPHPSLKGVAARIRERASGNPFFVEEAVLALEEAGYLSGTRGMYELAKPIEVWPVPDTVHALLAARMDRLEAPHKNLLQTAAVAGAEFSVDDLQALAEEQIEEGLGVLEDAGFVHQRRAANGEYAFCHPLMQEVAYSSQLESRRTAVHARIAKMLEQRHPEMMTPNEYAARIAWHWAEAGDLSKAGAWNIAATRWAASRDIRDAQRLFRLARDQYDRAPHNTENHKGRIAARSGLVRVAQFADIETAEIDQAYAEARQMAEDCGDVACTAELLLSYSSELLHRGRATDAADYAAQAVQLCISKGIPEMVQRFRLAVLMSHNAAGMPAEGIALVDTGDQGRWRTEPISEDNFASRAFHGLMLAWVGNLRDAEHDLQAAVDYAERKGRANSWMHANFVDLGWFTGRYELMLSHAQKAVQAAEAFGSPFFIAVAQRAMGRALTLVGRPAEGIPHLERVRPWVAPGGYAHQFEANHLAALADAYRAAGRFDEAYATAEAAIQSAQNSQSRVWESVAWLAFLGLPKNGPWTQRVPAGLARCAELIHSARAHGLLPWLELARAHWADPPSKRAEHYQAALREFERQGAVAQVQRWQTLAAA